MKSASFIAVAALALASAASHAQADRAAQVAKGQQVFERHCIACHGAGVGYPPLAELPGTSALRTRYGAERPAVLAERTDLTPEFVAFFVRNGISVMPFYRKTEIDDTELAALGAYLGRHNAEAATGKR